MKKLMSLFTVLCLTTGILSFPVSAESGIAPGAYVQMGTYSGDPILWRCVKTDETGSLLISDRILSLRSFDTAGGTKTNDTIDGLRAQNGSNLWEESAVRSWLNTDFLTGFTEEEKTGIKSVTLKTIVHENDKTLNGVTGTEALTYDESPTDVLQNYETAYAKNSTEKIFLPDIRQLSEIAADTVNLGENYHLAKPTAKAIENSGITGESGLSEDKNWAYFLRTPEAAEPQPSATPSPAPSATPVPVPSTSPVPASSKVPAEPPVTTSAVPSSGLGTAVLPASGGITTSVYVRTAEADGTVKSAAAKQENIGIRPMFYLDTEKVTFSSGDGKAQSPYIVQRDSTLITASVSKTSVAWDDTFTVSANKDGTLHLVPQGSYLDAASLENAKGKLKYTCEKEKKITVDASDLEIGDFLVYAVDTDGILSEGVGLQITKATPVVAKVPVASRIESGKRLSSSKLTGGTVTNAKGNTVSGTFKWETPTKYMRTAGTSNQNAVFTPRDTAHYNTVDLTVRVRVTNVSTGGLKVSTGGGVNYHEAYMSGDPGGMFRPEDGILRAETASVLARLSQNYHAGYYYEASFPDLESRAWYLNEVGFVEQAGIMKGDENGFFRPNDSITRAEFAAVIADFSDLSPGQNSSFADTKGHWAEPYIAALAESGLISGDGNGMFRPEDPITRAEAVKIINRALGRSPNQVTVSANSGLIRNPFTDVSETHWAYYEILEAAVPHNNSLFH